MASTTARGYGHQHQVNREALLYQHQDGTPCDWCGQPMYRDKVKNFDGAALEADHIDADKNQRARRLLHKRCNGQKGNRDLVHGPEWRNLHGITAAELHCPGGTFTAW